jgi:alkylation response protein AidB-like acyl-CoA dehydrogenase
MDFALSPEQQLLQETARSFVDRTISPRTAKEWDEAGHPAGDLLRGMGELGWFAAAFVEEDGGLGGTAVDTAVIAEELGRASLDVAMVFLGCLIPGLTLARWGTAEQKARYLPKLMEGAGRFAIAMSEPDAGSDAAALRTQAVERGDHYLVNGQKQWCTGAGVEGTTIATYVRTNPRAAKHRGLSLLLIDAAADGVELVRIPTLARHILGTYDVYLTDVRVPRADLVGQVDRGWEVMLSGVEYERVAMSAAYVGVAQATLDEALEYARCRRQFGRPIGEFQAIAHALADLQVEVDAARLLAYRAAWLHAHGRPCSREGAMAKLKGSETYVAAARLGMQVMAGQGFSTESVMSFRYRESIVAPISGGTSQIQRNAIARSMGLRPS